MLDRIARIGRNGAILIASSGLITLGCAQDRDFRSRAGQSSSTIARDRSTVPRGQTIPPAGLGVDLVRSGSIDEGALRQTSFSRVGVPGSAMP